MHVTCPSCGGSGQVWRLEYPFRWPRYHPWQYYPSPDYYSPPWRNPSITWTNEDVPIKTEIKTEEDEVLGCAW